MKIKGLSYYWTGWAVIKFPAKNYIEASQNVLKASLPEIQETVNWMHDNNPMWDTNCKQDLAILAGLSPEEWIRLKTLHKLGQTE